MHKTFLSYHHANEQDLKNQIIEKFGGNNFIDKSVSEGDINTENSEDSIMRTIREDYLEDTTITIVLIGKETKNRPFVNSEIQASLWGDSYNGLIGVIKDDIYDDIFTSATCLDRDCGCGIKLRSVGWGYEHYLPFLIKENHVYKKTVPHYNDTDVYCSLIKQSIFLENPEFYIDQAFNKRKTMVPSVKRNPPNIPAIRTRS